MGQLQVKPLGPLGSYGQNTESSQIDLPPAFAIRAINCFVDENGRLTARKSMKQVTAANTDLGSTNAVQRLYRHNLADGTTVMVAAGNGRIFTSSATTMTSRGSGYSTNLWQFATLNGKLFAAQVGKSLRYFLETTWAETTVATPSNPRAIHAAYGRLWALSSDGWTLYWSDLLDGTNFTTGASGSLDLSKIHTQLRSPGMAIVGFNRQIAVLCRDQVILLGLANNLNPNDTTQPIYLRDSIAGVGTIARDSVVATQEDVLFLADDGLRSLTRSLAESQGPAPLSDVSKLNRTSLMRAVRNETAADIAASWNPEAGWYQLFLPTSQEVWTFDIGQRVPDGNVPRVTTWRMGTVRPVYHGTYWADDTMYYGGKGGLYTNETYEPTDSYTFGVETGWLSFDSPDALKHLKALLLTVRGGSGQPGTVKWYVDFSESIYRTRTFTLESTYTPAQFGVDEYEVGMFTGGTVINDIKVHLGGTAKFFKFSIEFEITDSAVTLNNAQTLINMGRLK
jgi:hypothetical protein